MPQSTENRATFALEANLRNNESAGDGDLFSMLRIFWLGKWVILACIALTVLIGGYYAFFLAGDRFVATARLALDLRQSQVVDLEGVVSGVSTETSALNTELEFIKSRKLVEMTVEELGLVEHPELNPFLRKEPKFSFAAAKGAIRELIQGPPPKKQPPSAEEIRVATVNEVIGAISVTIQRNTYIFNIRATTGDRHSSTAIVNTLAQAYLDNQVRNKLSATESAINFLAERVTELDQDLKGKETELQDIRSNSNLISIESLDALSIRAKSLRDRMSDTQRDLDANTELQDQAALVVRSGDLSAIVEHFDDPTLHTIAARQDNPARQALIDSRLDLLQAKLAAEVLRTQAQLDALSAAVDEVQVSLAEQNIDVARIIDLTREISATRVLYETFVARLKETSIQIGLQKAEAEILSLAQSGSQIAPRRSRIIAMSIVLGGLLGCLIVFLRSLASKGFRDVNELEQATGLGVIGQVPLLPVRHRKGLLAYLRDNPTSAASEANRNLRTSLLMSNVDKPPKVLMYTSSIPGEGKTTQALALAHSFAGLQKKTLLIDGDVRRNTLQQYFKNRPTQGLVSLVNGEATLEDVMTFDETLGVHVIFGEKIKFSAADIFASQRFRDLIEKLREEFDYVIIDCPPVLAVTDGRIIGLLCDAIAFVVRWDSTTKDQVRESLRQLKSAGVGPTGLVLTQINTRKMRSYGYDGQYGAYGGQYYDA